MMTKSSRMSRATLEQMASVLSESQRASVMAFYEHRKAAPKPWKVLAWRNFVIQAARMGSPAFENRITMAIAQGVFGYPSSKNVPDAWKRL